MNTVDVIEKSQGNEKGENGRRFQWSTEAVEASFCSKEVQMCYGGLQSFDREYPGRKEHPGISHKTGFRDRSSMRTCLSMCFPSFLQLVDGVIRLWRSDDDGPVHIERAQNSNGDQHLDR